MPILSVETNLSLDKLPENFGGELSKFVADILEKPEARISVTLYTDRPMWRGGSSAPFIQLHLAAVGVVDSAEKTRVHSQKMFEFLQEKTGLAQDRIVVLFYPLQPWQVGLNGSIAS